MGRDPSGAQHMKDIPMVLPTVADVLVYHTAENQITGPHEIIIYFGMFEIEKTCFVAWRCLAKFFFGQIGCDVANSLRDNIRNG
jgi:hypothetical protein